MIREGLPNGAVLVHDWAHDVDAPNEGLRYNNNSRVANHDHPRLHNLDLIDRASRELDVPFEPSRCMWNVYSGKSGVPFHHDEGLPDIAILSVGDDAEFALHPCAACEEGDHKHDTYITVVRNGDLLYLPRDVNFNYAHGVRSHGNRASLVFRPRSVDGPWHSEFEHLHSSRVMGFDPKGI